MTLDPNGLDALVQAAKDRNVPLIDAKAIVRAYLVALASSAAVVPSGWKLTAYEVQVLIGTSISGCSMSPDRVFDLLAAWSCLFDKGLIDRTDGLAIVTPEGQRLIDAMLSASPSPPALDGAGREGWQPIETAPKDGQKFDGWQGGGRVTDVYWSDVQDAWRVDGHPPPLTHWKPLPTPPKETR